jgi:hypothetical protein
MKINADRNEPVRGKGAVICGMVGNFLQLHQNWFDEAPLEETRQNGESAPHKIYRFVEFGFGGSGAFG